MADDKTKRGGRDRKRVASGEGYEVAYFARKHGISQDEAQALIDRVGNDREKLDAAVGETSAAKPRGRRAGGKAAASEAGGDGGAGAQASSGGRSGAASNGRRKAAAASTSGGARSTGRGRSSAADASDGGIPGVAVATAAAEQVVDVADQAAELPGKTVQAAKRTASSARKAVTPTVTAATEAVAEVAEQAIEAPVKAAKAVKRGAGRAGRAAAEAPAATGRGARTLVGRAAALKGGRATAVVGAAAAGLVAGLAVNLGRKALVQAPSAFAGDWFEALKTEHRLALTLFDQLQETTEEETGKRSTLLTQLKHALGKHAFTEENVIYPALRDWGDKADADKLNHDHGYVKQHLYDLENMDNATPEFLTRVSEFRADIESHIREEEDAIFPPLHAALSAEENAKLTAQANKEGFKLA